MLLLGMRLLDFAIFGTLGTLWLGGAVFVVLLWRWVIRFERGDDVPPVKPEPMAQAVRPEPTRPPTRHQKPLVAAHS